MEQTFIPQQIVLQAGVEEHEQALLEQDTSRHLRV